MSSLQMDTTQITIGRIFRVSSGGTPSRKKAEYFHNGNIPWVKTGDLKGKFANKPKEFITQLGLDNSSAKLFPPKTVLLAMYGATIGACSILSFEAATNQACAAILPTKECDETYLYYYLTSIKALLISKGVGGAQPNISAGLIKKIKIPLPPLAEQQKIAAILDAADALRQKDQQLIDHYTTLSQSLFLEMFGDLVANESGYPVRKLSDVLDVRDGTHDSPKYVESGYPLVTSKNIKDGVLDLSAVNYISEEDYIQVQKRSGVAVNDIIMPMIGTIGNPHLVTAEPSYAIKNVALFRVSETNNINPIYLLYLLDGYFFDHFIKNNNRGGIQSFVSLGSLRKMLVPNPPVTLQNQFSERIQAIEAQKQQAQATLKKSEDLFNSLLQRAFKGELTA